MTGFTTLSFSQIISPTGGAASAPLVAQAAPLAGVSGGAVGILGVSVAAPTTDIFTLLLNQGNTLPQQENFSTTGQNVPQVDIEKLKTVDNSIDALQSVLTNLVVQQSIPQQQQLAVDSTAGIQSDDALLGGIQTDTTLTTDSVAAITSGDAPDTLGEPLQGLLAQNYQPKKIDSQSPQALSTQQFKTLDAYRQAANLTLPAVGSTIDATDSNAITAALKLPEVTTAEAAIPKAASKQDAILNLLESTDKSPSTLSNSINRLNSLSAITPLPQEKGKPQIGTAADGSKPLDQIASLQKALADVKPEADKPSVKADALAGQNNANPVNSQVVAQTGQQNLSQQFGQKKQASENIEVLKAGGEKIDSSDLNTQQSSALKTDVAKLPTHDFAQHLNKAAVGSPSEQIAMQIAKLPSGKQNITVQLDPADLGKVDVKLEIGLDGRTQISISAERKETLEMLKNDMLSLQRSLADSGIKADAGSLQFSLKGQDGFAGQLNQNGQQKNGMQTAQQIADAELQQTIESAALAARYVNLNNLLDLHV